MEIVTRMLDGSLPYEPGDARPGPPVPGRPLRQDDKIIYLEKVPIFQDCSRRQLRHVAKIAEVVEQPAGAILTRAGEPGATFLMIVDGAARAEVSADRQVRLGPGGYFGEMSLLDGEPRSATVVAETPVRLLVIDRRHFWTLLAEVPRLTQSLLVTLSRRVRQAEQALRG